MQMLITCVARAARSFDESCSLVGFAVWDLPPAIRFAFEFVVVLEAVRELVCDAVYEVSMSGSSSSFRVTTVAVVHVDVEARAVLAASAFACSEAI